MSMKYTEIFKAVKIENGHWKNVGIFDIFAQNIDCKYTLEPPFGSKIRKEKSYTPINSSFTI